MAFCLEHYIFISSFIGAYALYKTATSSSIEWSLVGDVPHRSAQPELLVVCQPFVTV